MWQGIGYSSASTFSAVRVQEGEGLPTFHTIHARRGALPNAQLRGEFAIVRKVSGDLHVDARGEVAQGLLIQALRCEFLVCEASLQKRRSDAVAQIHLRLERILRVFFAKRHG